MIKQLQLFVELEVSTIGPHPLQGPFIFYPCPRGHGGREGDLVPIFQ